MFPDKMVRYNFDIEVNTVLFQTAIYIKTISYSALTLWELTITKNTVHKKYFEFVCTVGK